MPEAPFSGFIVVDEPEQIRRIAWKMSSLPIAQDAFAGPWRRFSRYMRIRGIWLRLAMRSRIAGFDYVAGSRRFSARGGDQAVRLWPLMSLTSLFLVCTGLAFGQKLRAALNHCLSVSR